MQQTVNIQVSPHAAADERLCRTVAAHQLGIVPDRIKAYRLLKRSVDARQRDVKTNLTLLLFIDEPAAEFRKPVFNFEYVGHKQHVIVVGAGPAGLFAALRLIELGLKPVVIERGRDVSERKKDVARMSREHVVNPESNYCFGEGGAGTFSDGKLYTRSNKRGNLQRIYENFYVHGASDSVLIDAHPHIGTDRLPEIIKNMRQTILSCGGEMHFNTRVDNVIRTNNTVHGVTTSTGNKFLAKAIILATGHSARDIYKMLVHNTIELEAKPFAVGVRVEHPQELIDHIQYHGASRGEFLPAASYSLAEQVQSRGVFSFCMCPGGFIVPSATEQNQVVVNGMSASKRNSPFANSGIVVAVEPSDLAAYQQHGLLAGIRFQEHIEQLACTHGGHTQAAPAQRLGDFVNAKASGNLPKVSYFPGVVSSAIHTWLPGFVSSALQEGFKKFDRKKYGFLTNEAVVLGIESRTSSPLRIPRNPATFGHVSMSGLFPCGEGSGYAGGIASSAMDGENCANNVAAFLRNG